MFDMLLPYILCYILATITTTMTRAVCSNISIFDLIKEESYVQYGGVCTCSMLMLPLGSDLEGDDNY